MLDITDLCLIRVSFTCLKAVAFDNNGGVNRYIGGHVMPISSTIGLQSLKTPCVSFKSPAKITNSTTVQWLVGCMKGRWGMLNGGWGMCDISCRSLVTGLICFFPEVNDHVGKFKCPNYANAAANVCLICMFVMAIVKVLFPFFGSRQAIIVQLRHHFTVKNERTCLS